MKKSILSTPCIVFLLATVSSFGIGPGDNVRAFMAGDGNLAIQIHGSTNAAEPVSAGTEFSLHARSV